jgi:hypothetical protein
LKHFYLYKNIKPFSFAFGDHGLKPKATKWAEPMALGCLAENYKGFKSYKINNHEYRFNASSIGTTHFVSVDFNPQKMKTIFFCLWQLWVETQGYKMGRAYGSWIAFRLLFF